MSEKVIIYSLVLMGMGVLAFLSRNLELPAGITETGISRAYQKMSLFLYRGLKKKTRLFREGSVGGYLGTLEGRRDIKNAETEYYIGKISVALMMVTAGAFLALMMSFSSNSAGVVSEEGFIERDPFGGKDISARLIAEDEAGEPLGEYKVNFETRVFTEKEADELFLEASPLLEQTVLGENESFDRVTGDLKLVESLPGYPFQISWKLDNYEVLGIEGKRYEDAIPEEGVPVTLAAIYKYGEKTWQQEFVAMVLPRELSAAEKVHKEIAALLDKADKDSASKDKVALPDKYNGGAILWREKVQDNSMLLLLLTLIGAAVSYVFKDKELKKAMEERSFQMQADYPQFISQLVLYMSAGMTVRNIFERLSAAYLRERKAGLDKRFLYEEVTRAVRELAAGASEAECYEQFGLRCRGQQYTRLGTLLSQNLRKGNSALLSLLQEESEKSLEDRMDKVRKAGEEAGTKLLMPMVIMLVIVMVVIMIPAYMAF
ncbi:MAG: type II secretion system F family protein [Butyrivibrio sp.]|nr:type II secretion system F family protein [Butyrivibrio sp.]